MLRPQTWHLVLAVLFIVSCIFTGAGSTLQLLMLVVAAVTAAAIIPLYKRRRLQSKLCLLPMVLLLAWYVLLAVYRMPDFNDGNYCFPALAIVFIFMAFKGIEHDERVVRSLDRIR